jgi:hypothetical protein
MVKPLPLLQLVLLSDPAITLNNVDWVNRVKSLVNPVSLETQI